MTKFTSQIDVHPNLFQTLKKLLLGSADNVLEKCGSGRGDEEARLTELPAMISEQALIQEADSRSAKRLVLAGIGLDFCAVEADRTQLCTVHLGGDQKYLNKEQLNLIGEAPSGCRDHLVVRLHIAADLSHRHPFRHRRRHHVGRVSVNSFESTSHEPGRKS